MKLNSDIVWLLKWASSLLLIAGMASTSANLYPLNMYFHLTGTMGWLAVALIWHDRSLTVLNSVAGFIFLSGIINSLL